MLNCLPSTEIEDEIFEWAARLFPVCAPTLACISKRMQARVEYIIYETVFFIDAFHDARGDQVLRPDVFLGTLDARPAEFFVRRMGVGSGDAQFLSLYMEDARMATSTAPRLKDIVMLPNKSWLAEVSRQAQKTSSELLKVTEWLPL
ncbi:hypothetical protein DXG01_016085 [Tephrocybe rancida]|nr:hypothetical protein DXG01_016085 [Tephrocybe rancida]